MGQVVVGPRESIKWNGRRRRSFLVLIFFIYIYIYILILLSILQGNCLAKGTRDRDEKYSLYFSRFRIGRSRENRASTCWRGLRVIALAHATRTRMFF